MKIKNKNRVQRLEKLNKKAMTISRVDRNGSGAKDSDGSRHPINEECTEESKEDEYSNEDIEDESNVEDDDDLTPDAPMKRKHVESSQPILAKKSKLSEAALTKSPTAKELNHLRETENLFHSNLFRLQIEEMLKEMKLKSKYDKLLKKWIDNLSSLLLNMKASKKYLLSEAGWLKKLGIELPIVEKAHRKSDEKPDISCIRKPNNVSVIGSYPTRCFMGPNVILDVQIEMPKECFTRDDELNYRYHAKRAVYLGYIAHILQASDIAEEVFFSQSRNSLCPILEVKPTGKLAKAILVRLHLTVDPSTFKLIRFSPSKSKISSNLYFNDKDKLKVTPMNSPTPHYNSSVLQDLTMTVNEECRQKVIGSNSNLQDGITLLKVWLRQRQLDVGYGAFTGYIMSMYVVYLFQSRRLNTMMSSYQVARNVWNALAQSDWTTNGIILSQSQVENQPPLSEFHNHFEVVFIDVTGFLNLCSEVSKETFLRVKEDSILSVKFLDNPNINSFQALFLTPKPLHLQCDHIIRFQDQVVTKLAKKTSSAEEQMDYGNHYYPRALSLILQSLRCGLDKRVSLLCIQPPDVLRWPISNKPPVQSGPITLGLILDSDHAFTILEKGPEANVHEAEQFRADWGDKCELRRFQDGSISEVIVWEKPDAPASKKRLITRQIVSYLLTSKLGLNEDEFVYLADQFEPLLESIKGKPTEFHYGTGEEASLRVMKAFDSLVKQLRLLPDMPLDVSSVQGTSAVFRYADVFPPLAKNYWAKKYPKNMLRKKEESCVLIQDDKITKSAPHWVPPVTGIIQLGLSSKWPDDLDAIRRIQAAFYVSIAKQLTQHYGLTSQAHSDHIDVLKDGFVIRLQLGSQREIAMLKKMTTLDGSTKFRDTEESIELEKRVEHLPKISGALLGVHQRYTSFGPACCLAKRWLRSQMLDENHFPDICIELLVALLYVQPQPFTPPNQPQTAFFRFLRLLASTNWHSECLVLNFNDDLTRDEILQIEGTFNSSRSTLPALFIATPLDKSGSLWTKSAPSLQILIRVAQLASEALNILNTCFFTAATTFVNVNQLFMPTTDVYNVLIRLHNHMTPRLSHAIPKNKYRKTHSIAPYVHKKGEKIPVTGFDPVTCYLKQLREAYDSFALFFHDTYGGDCIGVLWKPSMHYALDFKVSQVQGRKLTYQSELMANLDAIIEDFYVIGEGLVHTIETKSSAD